jgi:hypothetical protein
MVLCNRHLSLSKSRDCSRTVKPCGSYEPGDRPAGDIFEQAPSIGDPRGGLANRQAQKLAFTGRHDARSQSISCTTVSALVAMVEPVQENLEALVGPRAQAASERRTGHDRRLAPVVRDGEQGDAIAYVGSQQIKQLLHLALEARRDVVNRGEQNP